MSTQRKNTRSLDGLLLLDKPVGISSNLALQKAKRYVGAKKAGHTGSLDPLASGLLPICLGQATKFSRYLIEQEKSYDVIGLLGEKRTTGDAEGEVVARTEVSEAVQNKLPEILPQFVGLLYQIPSMYSALKHEGKALYSLARKGIEIERAPRQVEIKSLHLLSQQGNEFRIRVECSKGTYMRTLIEDIGDALGVGAYVTELRRLSVGKFKLEQACTLPLLKALSQTEEISAIEAAILPVEICTEEFPCLQLTQSGMTYLVHGQSLRLGKEMKQGLVQLKTPDNKFLGVGEIREDGRLVSRRLLETSQWL